MLSINDLACLSSIKSKLVLSYNKVIKYKNKIKNKIYLP